MRAVAAAALLALAWPAAAAQAADYGGGNAGSRTTLLTVRTKANGKAVVRAIVRASCGVARIRREVTPAADGSFSFTATHRNPTSEPGVRKIARVAIAGRVLGLAASGTVSAKVQFRRAGQVVERCASAAHGWQARAAVAQPVAGPPRAGGAYQGLTNQNAGQPRALVLRVDAHGTRVTTAVFQYRNTCRKHVIDLENITPGGAIKANGTFSLRERFLLRFADASERFRVKVDGRFTPAGVNGTLSVSSVARSRTGAVIDRCRTGKVTFAGAL